MTTSIPSMAARTDVGSVKLAICRTSETLVSCWIVRLVAMTV
jgi:hypothetical protein